MNNDLCSEESFLSCDLCLREIPLSSDQSDEVRDYVAHYCGIECYQRWHDGEGQATS